jgi:hypothetical protein
MSRLQMIPWLSASALFYIVGCMQRSGDEGSPAIKVFFALGIVVGAVFLVFYIVVKGREKD